MGIRDLERRNKCPSFPASGYAWECALPNPESLIPAFNSLPADEIRALADGLFVYALAGAAVLGEAMLAHMAFTAAMGLAGHDLGCADDTLYRRAAVGALRERRIGEALQDFQAIAAGGAGRSDWGVLIDGHGVEDGVASAPDQCASNPVE